MNAPTILRGTGTALYAAGVAMMLLLLLISLGGMLHAVESGKETAQQLMSYALGTGLTFGCMMMIVTACSFIAGRRRSLIGTIEMLANAVLFGAIAIGVYYLPTGAHSTVVNLLLGVLACFVARSICRVAADRVEWRQRLEAKIA